MRSSSGRTTRAASSQPGDFGYVPPGTLHAYQLRGHYSTFVGPVVPGGWDRFFDLTGEPYASAAYPQGPKGPPPFEKFGRAEAEFQMKFRPDAQYAEARDDAADDTVPSAQQPYFLRAGEGTRHELGGQLQTLLVGADQTGGEVTMTTVELSKGPGLPAHVHEQTYEALMVVEGQPPGDARRRGARPDPRRHREHPRGHRARVRRRRALHQGPHDEHAGRARAADRHRRGSPRTSTSSAPAARADLDALREAAAELDVTFA